MHQGSRILILETLGGVYFGQDGRELVILLVGGIKRTQTDDIATAKQYWGDYNA
jgi:putative addiction module killer protein